MELDHESNVDREIDVTDRIQSFKSEREQKRPASLVYWHYVNVCMYLLSSV